MYLEPKIVSVNWKAETTGAPIMNFEPKMGFRNSPSKSSV